MCANMTFMSEVREQMTRQLAEDAEALRRIDEAQKAARDKLHASIREAAAAERGAAKLGPSAIARATKHYYTREYIGSLLKPKETNQDATSAQG